MAIERDEDPSEENVPWLRDMVGEELADLFSEDEDLMRAAVRRLVRDAQSDDEIETALVDLIETSLEFGNDDTSATVWAALILGEVRSERALDVLLRSLAQDDEELQEAARIAILRIGAPAIRALMERLEEEDYPGLPIPGYEVLGSVGAIGDRELTLAVRDFLEGRLERERRGPSAPGALEALCLAVARLGDRRQIETIRRMIAEDFRGRNPALTDALEMLEENVSGEAFCPTSPPWEERYGWLFEDQRERARVKRPQRQSSAPPAAPDDPSEDEERLAEEKRRRDLAVLYWGLNIEASDEDLDLLDEGKEAAAGEEPPEDDGESGPLR